MPPKPATETSPGTQELLDRTYLGELRVSVANLELTTMGRAQRLGGIKELQVALRRDKFMDGFAPVVCLLTELSGPLNELDSSTKMKVIDGNHRVAAQKANDEEDGDGVESKILVRVHNPMTKTTERMVADGMNIATSTFVPQLLVDELLWYRALVRDQQQNETGLGQNALCTKLAKAYKSNCRKPPSKATLLKYVAIVTNFKEEGIAAMQDSCYLEHREKGHADFKTFESAASRVTIRYLSRPEFQNATGVQQEVYVLRLASAFFTNRITLSPEEVVKLDACAKTVAREVASIEAIVPRQEWSTSFKTVMRKMMVKEVTTKFELQHVALDKDVEKYKKGLPAGMKPSDDHIAFISARPHRFLLQALEVDSAMENVASAYKANSKAVDDRAEASAKLYVDEANEKEAEAIEAAKKAAESAAATATLEKEAGDAAAKVTPLDAGASTTVSPTTSSSVSAAATPAATPSSTGASAGAASTSSVTTSSATAAVGTTKGGKSKVTNSKNNKRKRETAAPVIAAGSEQKERLAKLRTVVTKVYIDDTLKAKGARVESVLPNKEDAMLCFLNVASDPSILLNNPESTERLQGVLIAVAANIHPRGTLIIAMDRIFTFDHAHLARMLESEGLVMEGNPVISFYKLGQTGRIPDSKKKDLTSHAAVTLVAHKTRDYFCREAAPRRTSSRKASPASAPNEGEVHPASILEARGLIVQSTQPESGTFLGRATAEFLIQRFSSPGDAVMVTATDKDDLASLVLGTGRTLIAVISDREKEAEVEQQLNAACEGALQRGHFGHLSRPPKRVGPSHLPKCVPPSNVSESVQTDMHTANDMESDSDEEGSGDDKSTGDSTSVAVAKKHADHYGLEIKVSSKGGLGIFAMQDLVPDEVPGIPLMGDFMVLDVGETLEGIKTDGVPLYKVCETDQFLKILQSNEVSNEGATLYLKPNPACFLYYVNSSDSCDKDDNSSDPGDEDANAEAIPVFGKRHASSNIAETKAILGDSENGVVINLKRSVKKGEEVLLQYPLFLDSEVGVGDGAAERSMECDDTEGMGGGGTESMEGGGSEGGQGGDSEQEDDGDSDFVP